jgi:hypothetical protein
MKKSEGFLLTPVSDASSIGVEISSALKLMRVTFPSPMRLVVAGFLLAVAFVSSGGTATAGCGEPMLTLGGHSTHADAAPGQPKAPSGPNCSERPTAPPALPPSAPTKLLTSSELWAAREAIALSTFQSDPFRSIPDSAGRPIRRSSAPFHPPRSI